VTNDDVVGSDVERAVLEADPVPGAVWPAMVMFGLLIVRVEFKAMLPETLKHIVRPPAGAPDMPVRSEPAPLSASVVT